MEGYIKVHRKMMGNPIWQDPDLFRLWMFCLMKASYKERTVLIDKQDIKLSPGQFVTGRFSLHQEFNQGIPPRKQSKDTTLWSWLKKLEKMGNVDIKSYNKYSIVSIVNWCLYQETLTTEPQQTDNEVTTEPQQTDTNKKVNKVKNEKKKDYTSKIIDLSSRYSSIPNFNKLSKEYWDVIRGTRTTGKISESVIYNTMSMWERFDPVVVQYSLKTHIEAHVGMNEKYTLGIMRGTKKEEAEDRLNRKENKSSIASSSKVVDFTKFAEG